MIQNSVTSSQGPSQSEPRADGGSALLSLRSFGILTASGFATARITLACKRGSVTAVRGGIGSGKSLIFEALVGMQRPDCTPQGDVSRDAAHDAFDFVPQDARLGALPTDRVRTLFRGLPAKTRADALRVLSALRLDAERLFPMTFRQLSSGERTRVLWAFGLARKGELLLVDGFGEGLSEEDSAVISKMISEQTDAGRSFLMFCRSHLALQAEAQQVVDLGSDEPDGAVPLVKRAASTKHKRHRHALLEVEHLQVPRGRAGILGRKRAAYPVNGVSLYLRHGETLVVLGPSGSGKTTLLEALAGLQATSEGRIRFEGRDVGGARGYRGRSLRRHMQLVFEDAPMVLDSPRTVRAHLHEAARLSENAQGTPAAWVERLGLSPRLLSLPANVLSVGESQRIDLARSLVLSPHVVLFDAPRNAGIDADGGTLAAFVQTEKMRGIGFLIATSSRRVARSLGDRIAIMLAGRVVELGAAEKILSEPAHPFTRDWLRGDYEKPQDPRSPSPGCPYVEACDRRELPKCQAEEPPLVPLPRVAGAARRRVACFHPIGHEPVTEAPTPPPDVLERRDE